jgi:alkylated DNA repair dioxygenase AlkB
VAEYTPGFVQRSHLETGTRGSQKPEWESDRNKMMMMTETKSGISLYDPHFLPQEDADRLEAGFLALPWKQHIMKMHGKKIPVPRLYQWFGVTPCIYGETITPHEWTPETLEIQERVHKATGIRFDSLNVNYYRPGGTDHIGWHSDGEEEGLWKFPIVAVSFGAVRNFQTCPYHGNGKLKRRFHKYFGEPDKPIALGHGSIVVMPAGSQEFYVHRLKKATKAQGAGARINLTFRMMTPRS